MGSWFNRNSQTEKTANKLIDSYSNFESAGSIGTNRDNSYALLGINKRDKLKIWNGS